MVKRVKLKEAGTVLDRVLRRGMHTVLDLLVLRNVRIPLVQMLSQEKNGGVGVKNLQVNVEYI
jgi:hypothetical protein